MTMLFACISLSLLLKRRSFLSFNTLQTDTDTINQEVTEHFAICPLTGSGGVHMFLFLCGWVSLKRNSGERWRRGAFLVNDVGELMVYAHCLNTTNHWHPYCVVCYTCHELLIDLNHFQNRWQYLLGQSSIIRDC
ncbi:putative rotein [Trichinella spiralis]|uniref:Rotein n=1 Tax=Trichinella spiralis TaxID=6334 RepID=A0ABR3L3C4_TRISP